MQQQPKPRAATFLMVMSWIYIVLALGMIGLAFYNLKEPSIQLTFRVATDAVFLILGGLLGILAGIFGLVSKNLRRCRIMGAALLGIAAIPLAINLIAGAEFVDYWKNIAVMLLPFLYLLAALIKRSEKKPLAQPAATTASVPASAPAVATPASTPEQPTTAPVPEEKKPEDKP